ncbi:MAG TPA: hypothetical protein VMW27_28125, partial [Thermoanaerobaculia bacterium]|nr:hypothetical protein [Thermoanaerobaculia bacterium]
YVYINVDDNPQPMPELRRLLDLNLFYLYLGSAFRLQDQGDPKAALTAGRKAAGYAPQNPDSHLYMGILEYLSGNKEAALESFRKAQTMNPDFRSQFERTIQGEDLKALREDKAFLGKLFPAGEK